MRTYVYALKKAISWKANISEHVCETVLKVCSDIQTTAISRVWVNSIFQDVKIKKN